MKNLATLILADAPSTSLKIAYSYLIPALDLQFRTAEAKSTIKKKSSFKSLFAVDPIITNAISWDADWFNNYE